MVLYLNAAPREGSRTRRLAEAVLSHFKKEDIKRIDLFRESFPKVDADFITFRDGCIERGDFSSLVFDYAKLFVEAEKVVIAAPLYDLSFPSCLKQFFEAVNVVGLTFRYGEDGRCVSECHIHDVYYCLTSGGPNVNLEYGYGYVKALCQQFYGSPKCHLYELEGLDAFPGAGKRVEEMVRKITTSLE